MRIVFKNISALRDAHGRHISDERVSAASQVGGHALSHTRTDMLIHRQLQFYDQNSSKSWWLGVFSVRLVTEPSTQTLSQDVG